MQHCNKPGWLVRLHHQQMPAEKTLGFPSNTLASHTEARTATHMPLGRGGIMTNTGERPLPGV
ncbi:hypothetical protein [Stenotrophomonas indicatrix]|uniref:hypothetical protein n=1 Tax=Stenotrophomonas indicatrix TaxID=2045451 RepID=UPI003D0DB903